MNCQNWIVFFAILGFASATVGSGSGGSSAGLGAGDLPCTQVFTSGPASDWIPASALKKNTDKTSCVTPSVVPKTCASHLSACHQPATGYVHPSHYCAKTPTHYCAKAPTRYCAKVPNHYYGLGCGYHHYRPVNSYRGCYSYPRHGCYQTPHYGCYAPQTC